MDEETGHAVGKQDIRDAFQRIYTKVRRTPIINVEAGTFGVAHPLNLKLEQLQHTGSFKARGALNSLLAQDVPDIGVIAASGGNHGAAVAFAAQRHGKPAHIFVPNVTPDLKITRIEQYGAYVHVGGSLYQDAADAADRFAAKSGGLMIHAYDQPHTIAGQGTVALEWQEQAPDLDTVLVAVGGGGLIGGIAAWYRDSVRIVAVEPDRCSTLHEALQAGTPVEVEVAGMAADSLGARKVGELMFPIAQDFVDATVLVNEASIAAAQQALWQDLRIVVEPGGAVALAALVSGAYVPAEGEKVGVLICGANATLASIEIGGKMRPRGT